MVSYSRQVWILMCEWCESGRGSKTTVRLQFPISITCKYLWIVSLSFTYKICTILSHNLTLLSQCPSLTLSLTQLWAPVPQPGSSTRQQRKLYTWHVVPAPDTWLAPSSTQASVDVEALLLSYPGFNIVLCILKISWHLRLLLWSYWKWGCIYIYAIFFVFLTTFKSNKQLTEC